MVQLGIYILDDIFIQVLILLQPSWMCSLIGHSAEVEKKIADTDKNFFFFSKPVPVYLLNQMKDSGLDTAEVHCNIMKNILRFLPGKTDNIEIFFGHLTDSLIIVHADPKDKTAVGL